MSGLARSRVRRRAAAALWAALVAVLLLVPTGGQEPPAWAWLELLRPVADKLVHLCLFAVLGWLLVPPSETRVPTSAGSPPAGAAQISTPVAPAPTPVVLSEGPQARSRRTPTEPVPTPDEPPTPISSPSHPTLFPAAALSTGWGVLLELAQSLTPYRSADPLDALADLAGAVLGAWWATRP